MSDTVKCLIKLHADATVAYSDILNRAAADTARIEALEAALRYVIREFDNEPKELVWASIALARAALAPEQDK